jgi:PAS domain S-box-containing protein
MRRATLSDLWIAVDLAVSGTALAVVMRVVRGYFDDFSFSIIACYLAVMMLVRFLFGGIDFHKHFVAKLIATVWICVFAAWLYYEASNVRAGWYRTHVIQDRIGHMTTEAPFYAIVWNTDGVITQASANINLLTGYYREELIGKPMTVLLQPRDRRGFAGGMKKATEVLRRNDSRDAGWLMQGKIIFGLVHRDGKVVPVRAYSGGIRWSQDVQFKGDTDLFAMLEPVDPKHSHAPTTIDPKTPVQVAPPPPPTKTLVPSEIK